jgi:hypothetical protein
VAFVLNEFRMRRLRKFISLPAADRDLFVRAAFLIGVIRVGLWLLPSRTVLHAVSWHGQPAPIPPGPARERSASSSPLHVGRLAWAIRAAARYAPAATCLTQAIALQWLLARSGYAPRIHVGVRRGAQARFEAHAWVECNRQVVIGGAEVHDYVTLASW